MSSADTNIVPMRSLEENFESPNEAEYDLENQTVVRQEILDRIYDSLRLERYFRERGQKIQQIYKGKLDARGNHLGESLHTKVRFNILNANTGILLPSLFSKPPEPDVRARAARPSPFEQEAAKVLEDMCSVFLDNTETYEQLKASVKEMLLPGRGTCRVRWDPLIDIQQIMSETGGEPMTVMNKLLDRLYVEHVYWEDYTHESVGKWSDCGWVAYRHLFTEEEFDEHFSNSKSYQMFRAKGKTDEIFKWTDFTANFTKEVGERQTFKETNELQDHILKAMVWEYWDKSTREVIWICHDMNGHILRIDPDPLELENFFPSPQPLQAVTTTDTMLPTSEYEIYQDLAVEIDAASDRINSIVRRIKVRGAYNGSQEGLANILQSEDGLMTAVEGLDIDHDISKHIYIISNADNVAALQALYQARHESKQAMYEVTGISDIVRGQSRASETLGAQRIKSQFANLRIQDRKDAVENFCRDIIRIMCEIIASQFDGQSFAYYLGYQPHPQTLALLSNAGLRMTRIDVESDSTVAADEQGEIEAMSALTQSLAVAMQQLIPLVTQGVMPMPVAVEFLKMLIKPFKHSREVMALLDQYVAMLQQQTQPQPGVPNAPQP